MNDVITKKDVGEIARKTIQEILAPLQMRSQNSLQNELAESRRFITNAKQFLANAAENVNKLDEVARLRQENAAYRLAITVHITDQARENMQQRYEEALQAIKLGVNPYWMVIASKELEEEIVAAQKLLRSTFRKRKKLTIEQIELCEADIMLHRDRIQYVLKKLNDQKDKAIQDYADTQGVD